MEARAGETCDASADRTALGLPRELCCPKCGEKERFYRDGLRYLKDGRVVQRWLCRNCGFRFSETKLNHRNMLERFETVHRQNLKTTTCFTINRRVSVPKNGTKNSAKAVQALKQTEKKQQRTAGVTEKTSKTDLKGKIVEFLWWMKKEGYSDQTIIGRSQILKRLVKLGADLLNPASVKAVIAQQKHWSQGRKANVVYAYSLFAKWANIEWKPPKISVPEKLPFIPLEREIDDLIAGCPKHVAVALQIAKETGARIGEIFRLKWTDIDFESKTLRITPEKGSHARIFRMSNKLIAMLNSLPKTGKRILSRYRNVRSMSRTFQKKRKRIAHKFGNPRLLQISFHTLRHWKATMEYYKTKDILHVMQVLGHKNIKNTLIYTHLAKNIGVEEDEYISKVAKTVEEVRSLVEAGFEYVCEIDGFKVFRKRK